jgi:putative superfamily III holin-X
LDAPVGIPSPDPSLGDLFGRLADDGKAFVRAEADLYKAIALHRAGKARNGIIAIVAGALLIEAALIVFLVGLALGLALHVGPVLGGLLVAAGAGLAGYFLIRFGAGRMKALSGDAEEKAAMTEQAR